jgi:hypothetical protein
LKRVRSNFGLPSRVMPGLRSLTEEITRTTTLFHTANDTLEARLAVDPEIDQDPPALALPNGGRHAKRLKAKA